MVKFLGISKRISESLDNLEKYKNDYNKLIKQVDTSVLHSEDEKKIIRDIEEISLKFKNISKSVKDSILRFSEDLGANREDKINAKIFKVHLKAHSKRLTQIINKFRDLQFAYQRNEEKRIKILCDVTNEENVEPLSSSTRIHELCSLGKTTNKAKVEEAYNRKQELQEIKRVSEELIEINKIIADNIFAKSEDIDRLTDHIVDTEENMINSNLELERNLRYKIKRRNFLRKCCYIIIFLLLVFFTYKAIKNDWFSANKKD